MTVEILTGDCREVLTRLPDASVNCIVTSPPYYGLRDYGVDGQIGLEGSPDAYVAEMVAVFREARRVLRDDGTLWLNLGDAFATVGTKLSDCLAASIKGGVLFFGARCTLTVAAKGQKILRANKAAPNRKLTTLFGAKRIRFKQGDDHLGQVLYLLHPESAVRIAPGVPVALVGETNAEVVLDAADGLEVVISERHLDADAALGISAGARSAKHGEAAPPVKEAAKPIAEGVGDVQPIRDAVSLDATRKGLLKVDPVDQPVPLVDAAMSDTEGLRDFRVTEASREHLTLALMNGRVQGAFESVSHLLISNRFGSLMRYSELYDQAQRQANARQPKQLLGLPDRVKRALQEDGWICRSSIIWSKPNPMPESVRDRPTSAHEKVFLFAKSPRYFYDREAIREPVKPTSGRNMRAPKSGDHRLTDGYKHVTAKNYAEVKGANARNVWTITPKPFKGAHFAVFPPALVEPCIKAGCPVGGTVLDPFGGSGTTGLVAERLGRRAILIELNAGYAAMAEDRLSTERKKGPAAGAMRGLVTERKRRTRFDQLELWGEEPLASTLLGCHIEAE